MFSIFCIFFIALLMALFFVYLVLYKESIELIDTLKQDNKELEETLEQMTIRFNRATEEIARLKYPKI